MQLKVFNKDNQTITVTPYGIAEQLVTIYGETVEGAWNAETTLQALAHSYLDIQRDESFEIIEALNYLNYKLEAVRKTISFWDAYQIRGAVTAENIQAQLSQLPNNSSLINNTTYSFTWYDNNNTSKQVYPGDVFIKDYQNIVHLIPATNKGVYVPDGSHASASGTTLVLPFQYTDRVPEQNDTITIEWSNVNFGDNSGYNIRGSIAAGATSNPFPKIQYNNQDIKPIIKTFTVSEHELILNAHTLSVSGDNYVITNTTPMTIYFEVR